MVLVMRGFREVDKAYECNNVLGFERYSHLIEECKTSYQLGNKKKVIRDTLARLKEEAGNPTFTSIGQYLLQINGGHLTTDMVIQHIREIVLDLIKKEGDVMASLEKTEDTKITKNVVQGLIELMASLTVEEVIHKLAKNEKEMEDTEYGEAE